MTGKDLGLQAFISFEYIITPGIFLTSIIGYRFAEIDNLDSKTVYIEDLVLDFSGLFIQGGIRIQLF